MSLYRRLVFGGAGSGSAGAIVSGAGSDLRVAAGNPYLWIVDRDGAEMSSWQDPRPASDITNRPMKTPDFSDRLSAASAAKKAQLERARAIAEDPERLDRIRARTETVAARKARIAEHEAARRAAMEREAAELAAAQAAEESAREAARKAREEAHAARLAEQAATEAAAAAEREALLAARRAGRRKKKRRGR
jgi:hypothetical protein